jgi:DNA polymerase I-like protein with 3'-5' exonuclease and polymerase domains
MRVCCPVHDAFLCEAPETEAEAAVTLIKHIMTKASVRLLGVPCRVDARVIRAGERYQAARGAEMWKRVMSALVMAESRAAA